MKSIIFLLSPFLYTAMFSSFEKTSEWENVYLKNVGYIAIPPSMEVQRGKYKVLVDEARQIYGYDASQLTIQQKGLNDFGQESFQKYARIMLETTVGSYGDYEKLDFDFSGYSAAELNQINNIFLDAITQGFLGTELKLIEWFPVKLEKVNGYSAIHIRYKRRLGDKPLVMVNMYVFMNNDRKHTLTLSYRISEEYYWKSDLEKALASFRITNRR